MERLDLHTHTVFCDGNNTPEEMVLSAIEKGLKTYGISGHSFTSFDLSYCMGRSDNGEGVKQYIAELKRLKEKYKDRIEVLIGVEQDQFSSESTEEFDYVIGSTHYLKIGDEYITVDYKPEYLTDACERFFNGDFYALCEYYFEEEAQVIERTGADIIGHFDLISKLNEKEHFFDEDNERYIAAWKKAADILLKTGKVFEINTGAISRGYRTEPYPSISMIEYLKERGAKFILSSDSHSVDTIAYDFEKYEKYVK